MNQSACLPDGLRNRRSLRSCRRYRASADYPRLFPVFRNKHRQEITDCKKYKCAADTQKNIFFCFAFRCGIRRDRNIGLRSDPFPRNRKRHFTGNTQKASALADRLDIARHRPHLYFQTGRRKMRHGCRPKSRIVRVSGLYRFEFFHCLNSTIQKSARRERV